MLKVLHVSESKLTSAIKTCRCYLPEKIRLQKSFIIDTENYSALVEVINTDSLGCANILVREIQAKLFDCR